MPTTTSLPKYPVWVNLFLTPITGATGYDVQYSTDGRATWTPGSHQPGGNQLHPVQGRQFTGPHDWYAGG